MSADAVAVASGAALSAAGAAVGQTLPAPVSKEHAVSEVPATACWTERETDHRR